jgi:hypothetical protein
MDDKEIGIIIGKLETFQADVGKRFDEQRGNFSKIFGKLEEHDTRITMVEGKTTALGKVLWIIPTLIALLFTAFGLWLRYG